ncbi:MAG: YgjV family protein, partial [Salinispira sp.]
VHMFMNISIIEVIGYVASAFVAGSLLMTAILKLRILNLIGSLCFIAYGILLPTIPVLITNLFIAIINIVQLARLHKEKRQHQHENDRINEDDRANPSG